MKIALCNGKGGTGKTTLTVLLAHALAAAGKIVAVLDRDPQATATQWLQTLDSTPVSLYEPGQEYEAIFIDTPPAMQSAQLAAAIAEADVVIAVSSPSPADLWTTRDTVAVINQHISSVGKARILFNKVQKNTVLSRNLPDLAKRIGLKPLRTTISRKQCYQHSALFGWQALPANAREELFRAAIEIV